MISTPAKACGPISLRPLNNARGERWLAPGPVVAFNASKVYAGSVSEDYLYLHVTQPVDSAQLERQTQSLYEELLRLLATQEHSQLVRVWNYISDINQGSGDQEIYRRFCYGRALAFEEHFAKARVDFAKPPALPAATAIGSSDGMLRITALCARPNVSLTSIENPRQTSAFDYPKKYGVKAPLFARATLVQNAGQRLLLLSGTASIVCHESMHPSDLYQQTAETQRNVSALLEAASQGNTQAQVAPLRPVSIRYYLRSPGAIADAKHAFQSAFPAHEEPDFLIGDVCRRDLLMEVEAVYR